MPHDRRCAPSETAQLQWRTVTFHAPVRRLSLSSYSMQLCIWTNYAVGSWHAVSYVSISTPYSALTSCMVPRAFFSSTSCTIPTTFAFHRCTCVHWGYRPPQEITQGRVRVHDHDDYSVELVIVVSTACASRRLPSPRVLFQSPRSLSAAAASVCWAHRSVCRGLK